MAAYTNEGLVAYVKKALNLKTKYMWAGTMNPITNDYITQKVNWCKKYNLSPSKTGYTDARIQQLRNIVNRGYYGVDCVCLIKSYLWGGTGSPKYDASTDLNAGAMYERATVKGKIDTMPDTPGLIVYSKTHPHVGVYIGNGETIESTLGARGDGVVKHKLDNFWEYWFECPFIEYIKPQKTTLKTVKLAFNARIREQARATSKSLGLLTAGTTCVVIAGTETKDPKTNYTYIKLYGQNGWIVTTTLPGGKA